MAAAVFAAGLALAAGAASAAHLEYYNDAATEDTKRFEVFCNGGTCDPGNDGIDILASPLFAQFGIYTDNDTDPATQNGQLFDIGNDPVSELTFVNDNRLAGDDLFASGVKTELGGGDDDEDFLFTSDARYILLAIGTEPRHGLLVNLSGMAIEYNFQSLSGQGAGLSHFTEFGGGVSQIPLPATLPLLIGGLAGLGYFSRRKKAA